MSRFLDGISTIISVFHKYAKEDGDCSNLSYRKMQEFIQREFADVIAKPRDPQTIDKILQFLEWDGDGHIDFNEFLLLVFRVAKACYWFQPKGPYLLQRTKLTSSGKLHQEPQIKNRGSRRQLQEEEEQIYESNHHPPRERELQRDTRVNEPETLEEIESYQQHNTQSINDAKRSRERREPIPQVYEERSQEPYDEQNSQRRRQPPELSRQADVQLRKQRGLEVHEPRLRRDERKYQEGPQQDQLADIRSRSQTCETRPLQNRWSSRQPHEPVGPAHDDRNQWPQAADRRSDNQPRKPELLTEERSRYHRGELEQRALEEGSHKLHEPECLDSRAPHQSYIKEPLVIDLRNCNTCELERRIDADIAAAEAEVKIQRVSRELEPHEELERRECELERLEAEEERRVYLEREREEPLRERRLERQRDLDLGVIERRRHQTREREERDAIINQRERRERRDLEVREAEIDARRQRDLVRLERIREAEIGAAAEADVKIQRVSWELEPHEELERRERELERLEAEEERRFYLEREREEALRERRLKHQRHLDLDAYDHRHRQAHERGGRGATTSLQARERSLYQTVELDNRDLCLPEDQASVTDMRVSYIPAENDVPPEVKVAPQPCDPQTISDLVRVIPNLDDSEATTCEVICPQPRDLGQPIYVKKGYTSSQPLVPSERSNNQEPQPQRDEQEIEERELLSRSQENTGDLNEPRERSEIGVKEGAYQASASELSGVKDEARRCCEDAKGRQPRQENIKRRRQEAMDAQPQWEEEARQQSKGSQEASSRPARDVAKAS
uniref:Uncharacterized protein n=1 Tax=Melopsittacus undulatus TaxID=13146 RepID=A0A8C6JMG8_MELUD